MPATVVGHVRLPVAFLAALVVSSAVFAQTPLIEQGRAAIRRGDTAAAIVVLEKAVAESPRSEEAHFYLGNAYAAEGQKSSMLSAAQYASRMKSEFEKTIALNPRNVEARFGLVQFYAGAPYLMGGSYDKAFEHAKASKAVDPIVGHRAYAVIYSLQKKPDLAKQEYVDAIREQPNSPKAHSYFGQYLVNTEKNYTAGFAEFETALTIDPYYMAAFYHLGRAAAVANTNLARGEAALKRYLAYTPRENEPRLANAHYSLGAIYENEGKQAEAKLSYLAALKLDPSMKQASDALKRVS